MFVLYFFLDLPREVPMYAFLALQRSWCGTLSVVSRRFPQSVSQLSQNLLDAFLQMSLVGCPRPDEGWIYAFVKKNLFSFWFFFLFVCLFVCFFVVAIFLIVINIIPRGTQYFKTLLLPQIAFIFFKRFLNFLHNGPLDSTVLNFWSFECSIFLFLFLFLLTWDPIEGNASKGYYFFKSFWITPNLSWIFYSVLLTKAICLDLWHLKFRIFKDFFRTFYVRHCNIEGNQKLGLGGTCTYIYCVMSILFRYICTPYFIFTFIWHLLFGSIAEEEITSSYDWYSLETAEQESIWKIS